MDYQKLAEMILDEVGTENNIFHGSHCITRLLSAALHDSYYAVHVFQKFCIRQVLVLQLEAETDDTMGKAVNVLFSAAFFNHRFC